MNIYGRIDRFRRNLARENDRDMLRLAETYYQAYKIVDERLQQLLQKYAEGTISRSDIVHLVQYADTMEALNDALYRLGTGGFRAVARWQAQALEQALLDVQEIMDATGFQKQYQPPPLEPIKSLVGALGDGTPLSDWLNFHYQRDRAYWERELLAGIAAGWHPKVVAQRLRSIAGASLTRILRTVRTETMRAYRTATLAAYRNNPYMIAGYEWLATKSPRTCPACLALDGRRFGLNQYPKNHVNCRCTIIPVFAGEELPPRQTASQWFDEQPASVKIQVLGKKGYDLYQQGVPLRDWVHEIVDPKWGNQYVSRTPTQNKPRRASAPRRTLPSWNLKSSLKRARSEWTDYQREHEDLRKRGETPHFFTERGWLERLGAGRQKPYRATDLIQRVEAPDFGDYADIFTKEVYDKLDKALLQMPEINDRVVERLKQRRVTFVVHDNTRLRERGVAFRAFYDPRARTIHITSDTDVGVVLHEYAHHIEREVGLVRMSKQFLSSRAEGPPQRLSDLTGIPFYDDDEEAYPDKFINPYVGKLYNDATEVLSMGVQAMYDGPVTFRQQDEDHFLLTVASLVGW